MHNKGDGFFGCICIFESVLWSQTTSHAPCIDPWYFSYVDKRDTTCWFLSVHVIVPVSSLETYPKVDFLSSIVPSQSELIYPHIRVSLLFLYKMSAKCPFHISNHPLLWNLVHYLWHCHEFRIESHNITQIKSSGCKRYQLSL